ncbi:hypothetical protein PR048_018644 [Dryococelus australis]|uniref:HTH CENPB-type domain-containing protein n=1 Tax=Dryococelus australis TaxID=614101 RepID=A0ABQ9HD91_9NEOP|nr:hypothetical protein PR048_018644 [Dryococelus australis]
MITRKSRSGRMCAEMVSTRQDQKIPVSGPLIQAKAEQFASDVGKNYVKASHGWLDGFKSRNQIVFKSVCGESGEFDVQAANE